jgi:hypothetical protein
MRQSQPGTRNNNKHVYKSDSNAQPTLETQNSGPPFFPRSAIRIGIGIMVSAWLILKAFVAISPLTSVYAQYGESSDFPLLLDATGEDLTAGLEMGQFTSVDLVNVSTYTLNLKRETHTRLAPTHLLPGIYRSYSRREFNASYGNRNQPGCIADCERLGRGESLREATRVSF